MPVLDKQKLLAFSKKKAATPLGAGALAAKRAQAKPPGAPQYQLGPDGQPLLDANGMPIPLPPPPAAPPPPAGAAPHPGAPPAPPHKPVAPLPGAHAGPPPGMAPKPKPGVPPPHAPPGGHAPPPHAAGPAAPHPGAPYAPGVKKVMPMHPPPMPGHEPPPAAPPPEGEQEVHIFELVEDAAQAAEGALDQELEDTIAGTDSTGPEDVPPWAQDPQKWAEAAEAVGLGMEGVQDKYEEPFVVTAYLYKMIGGPVAVAGLPGAEEGGASQPEADMTKPGAAAKALQARAAAKAPMPGHG